MATLEWDQLTTEPPGGPVDSLFYRLDQRLIYLFYGICWLVLGIAQLAGGANSVTNDRLSPVATLTEAATFWVLDTRGPCTTTPQTSNLFFSVHATTFLVYSLGDSTLSPGHPRLTRVRITLAVNPEILAHSATVFVSVPTVRFKLQPLAPLTCKD